MLGELSPWHLLIVAVVFLALFGYKKLPDATRSVGRSLRIFKSEMKGMHDEEPAKEQAPKTPPVIEAGRPAPTAASPQSTAAESGTPPAPPTSGA
jgi:sec-independent protein translocase protein TatA